jgi:Chlorophyll A-B binding protein
MSTDEQAVPPQATEPTATDSSPAEDSSDRPAFGWTPYAELINGRFAMIGFVALLLIELITGQDFFTWIGWR